MELPHDEQRADHDQPRARLCNRILDRAGRGAEAEKADDEHAGGIFDQVAAADQAMEFVGPRADFGERGERGVLRAGLPRLLERISGHASDSVAVKGADSSALMRWMRTATAPGERPVTSRGE